MGGGWGEGVIEMVGDGGGTSDPFKNLLIIGHF